MSEHPVNRALRLIKSGDQASGAGDHERALSCYKGAATLALGVSENEWNQRAFLAVCSACISAPLANLGRYEESLQHAERALEFFDSSGELYPAERGRWFMALFNRGAVLAKLGRPADALPLIRKARTMIPAGLEGQKARAMCDHNIQIIESALSQPEEPKGGGRGLRMRFAAYLVALAIALAASLLAWKLAGVTKDRLPLLIVLIFLPLSIVGDLMVSKRDRQNFKDTYRRLAWLNEFTGRHRPKQGTLIVLSAAGIIGSLVLGIPVLALVFAAMLTIFVVHAVLMR